MEIKEIKEFMTWCQQGPSINKKRRKMRIDKIKVWKFMPDIYIIYFKFNK